MANWKELEKQFTARLALGRRPVAVTFLDARACGRCEIFRHRARRMQFLATGRRGTHVLHRSRRSFQLRGGSVHAQHSACRPIACRKPKRRWA